MPTSSPALLTQLSLTWLSSLTRVTQTVPHAHTAPRDRKRHSASDTVIMNTRAPSAKRTAAAFNWPHGIHVHHRPAEKPLPAFLRRGAVRKLSALLCIALCDRILSRSAPCMRTSCACTLRRAHHARMHGLMPCVHARAHAHVHACQGRLPVPLSTGRDCKGFQSPLGQCWQQLAAAPCTLLHD